VPAGVLTLKPLEIFLGQWIDTPEVGEPASGEELCRLMHIALVGDAVPGFLDVLVMDLQTVLLQRHQIAAIVVIVDPAPPHLREAVPLLATILGPVLDEGADSCVDESVVVKAVSATTWRYTLPAVIASPVMKPSANCRPMVPA